MVVVMFDTEHAPTGLLLFMYTSLSCYKRRAIRQVSYLVSLRFFRLSLSHQPLVY